MNAMFSQNIVAKSPMALDLVLPWQADTEQEERFKAGLKTTLGLLLLLFIIIPWLPQLEKEYEEKESDIVVTKILLKPVVEPPPPKVVIKEKKIPPKKVEKVRPKDVVQPKPKSAAVKTSKNKSSSSAKKTAVKATKVEEKVSVESSQGLTELSSQLSALRGSLDVTKLKKKNVADNQAGTAARSTRQVLGGDQASRKSGGINVDGSITKNSSTSLASHTTTAVDGLVENGSGPSGNQSYASLQQGKRDMESIRRTLERTKSNVYSLYQRALINQPELAGKFVFKLWIEPSGAISRLTLVSSELGVDNLEKRILARIKRVDFGPEDVSQTAVEYKFIFLPN